LLDLKNDDGDKLASDSEQVLNVDQNSLVRGNAMGGRVSPAVLFLTDQHAQDVARLRWQ
jgi:hypothetical protein